MNAPRFLLIVLALVGTASMIYWLNRVIFGETASSSLVRTLLWTGVVAAYAVYVVRQRRGS